MKSLFLTVLALAVLLTAFPSLAAADSDCPELATKLEGRIFIAKKPLYDTKVAPGGIVKLERDNEEIPEGATFTVLDVDCSGTKVELTLRLKANVKHEKVKVKFLFTAAQRALPNADGTFEEMMSYVFEYPEDSAKPED
ncbi:MAG: hypothetical protein WBH85_02300 [Thermoanaerobaculia bacterium]